VTPEDDKAVPKESAASSSLGIASFIHLSVLEGGVFCWLACGVLGLNDIELRCPGRRAERFDCITDDGSMFQTAKNHTWRGKPFNLDGWRTT